MNLLNSKVIIILVLLPLLFLSASSSANESSANTSSQDASIELDVYKSPTCGCCGKWTAHMQEHGFLTKTHNSNNLNQLKDEKGVPKNFRSCHTAVSKSGYIFEGHIPAKIVKQFLKEKPANSIGLVVPGMPVGSPGMAYQNRFSPYDVLSIHKDGTVSKYAKINTEKEQFE
jgi:hypothetical protein